MIDMHHFVVGRLQVPLKLLNHVWGAIVLIVTLRFNRLGRVNWTQHKPSIVARYGRPDFVFSCTLFERLWVTQTDVEIEYGEKPGHSKKSNRKQQKYSTKGAVRGKVERKMSMPVRRTRRSREIEKLLPMQWLTEVPVRHFGFSSYEWMDSQQKMAVGMRAARLAARKCEYADALSGLRQRAERALSFCRTQDEALEWLRFRAQRAKFHCGRQRKTLEWLKNMGQRCKDNATRLSEVAN